MARVEGGNTISELQLRLRLFCDERDWAQFHTPKNLLAALVAEVGELAEAFLWLANDDAATVMADGDRAAQIRDEIADVTGCVLRLADVLGIDLDTALSSKMSRNAEKYPVERAKGSPEKYTRLGRHT